jgi:hypothetical protein
VAPWRRQVNESSRSAGGAGGTAGASNPDRPLAQPKNSPDGEKADRSPVAAVSVRRLEVGNITGQRNAPRAPAGSEGEPNDEKGERERERGRGRERGESARGREEKRETELRGTLSDCHTISGS